MPDARRLETANDPARGFYSAVNGEMLGNGGGGRKPREIAARGGGGLPQHDTSAAIPAMPAPRWSLEGGSANGNLTSDGATTYAYDAENRLISGTGATNAALKYDPLGRLYEVVSGGATTRFLYDGDELVAEYNAAGTMLHRYVHGQSVDDPVVWYPGASVATSNQRHLASDRQGSVVAVADSNGNSLGLNRYDEYGNPSTSVAGSGQLFGRFGYTGQIWLPELKLWHYKARLYSPGLGRFLQVDPVAYDDQINLYAYVGNDPANASDPDGMCPDCLFAGQEDYLIEQNIGPEAAQATRGSRSQGVITGSSLALPVEGLVVKGFAWLGQKLGLARAITTGTRLPTKATTPYSRPAGATTPKQRASVQGKPCAKCGATTPTQRAGHKEALVKEHHRTGGIDRQRMRSTESVQPECPTCSAKEGAEMSRFSREMNEELKRKGLLDE